MKESRLNIRLDSVILEKMKIYCKDKHVTMTALVEQYFIRLLAQEEKTETEIVEQI